MIHHNTSSSEIFFPLLFSHIKMHLIKCLGFMACKQYLICAYFSPKSDEMAFLARESNIMHRGLIFLDRSNSFIS